MILDRVAAVAGAAALACGSAHGDIIHVPADAPSIFAAVFISEDGDEIVVADGVYDEPGMVNVLLGARTLTIRSESGVPETCILDGHGAFRAFILESSDIRLEGLTIANGLADEGGGVYANASRLVMVNCIVEACSAETYGGGIALVDCVTTLTNTIVRSCTASDASDGVGGGVSTRRGDLVLVGCTIEDNLSARSAGGVHASSAELCVDDCRITGNRALDGSGGGVSSTGTLSSMLMRRTVLRRNESLVRRGGGLWVHSGAMHLAMCTFSDNVAGEGGGMSVDTSSPVVITSCLFVDNVAPGGGAVWVDAPDTHIDGTTMFDNFALDGAAIMSESGMVHLANSVVWAHATDPFDFTSGGTVAALHSIVQGGWPGLGNLDADPEFTSPTGPDGELGTDDDDFTLEPTSPAIDAGLNRELADDFQDVDDDGITAEPMPYDIAGHRRVRDGDLDGTATVDMGAHELAAPCLGDLNLDDEIGVTDLLGVLAAWGTSDPDADLDGSGVVDFADLLILLAAWGFCP